MAKVKFQGYKSVGGYSMCSVNYEIDVGEELTKEEKLKVLDKLIESGTREVEKWTLK